MATYTSQYPPTQSDDYVKSTTKYSTDFWPYYATDPAKSLTGVWDGNAWLADSGVEQRFHIDLGSAKTIKRIYYENGMYEGGGTDSGVQNFTFWGSNIGAGSFDDLVYGNDGGWTELTCSQNTFDEHVANDVSDPKYIVVTNTTAYRYYAIKCADERGYSLMSIRRVELQTEDEEKANSIFFSMNF